jgi:hypothetical protein
MATPADIAWFKQNFAARMAPALNGTVFDVDMLTALACQETSELWGRMRHVASLTPDKVMALCCGDTLDADKGRSAFPRVKADLLAVDNGPQMFAIARQALLDMAVHVPDYRFANTNTRKFAHGFGVFQFDIQFFLTNPQYFLQRRYEVFENSLGRAMEELKRGLRILGLQNRTSISDMEFCHVAICYNTGGFNPQRGLRQGHQDNGKFYGEFIRDFLAMARTVATPGGRPAIPAPPPGRTVPPEPGQIKANGPSFKVETRNTPLRLRAQPRVSAPPTANVLAELPDGHVVKSVTGTPVNGFIELETMLGGKVFHGFASAEFLVRLTAPQVAKVVAPPALPALPEAHLRRTPGSVTKRRANAGAHSLNEPDMPRRTAAEQAGLRAQLGAIIRYLDTENFAHLRYRPRDGLTFCNIYAHDFCTLAGAYLPRVWWSAAAAARLATGQAVEALLGNTVDEIRANDLFRWLRDSGQSFGWRRAGNATELQNHANTGGIGLIVARRKEDGRSGHIVMVVPETADESAKRDPGGAVTMPLQSQAGMVNFRYGRSTLNWWADPKFAEFAFWVHP